MVTSETYRAVLEWFYPIFFVLSLISQSFVIYLISYHTPKNLHTLKWILVITCVCQVIHVFVCSIMQFRQVSHLIPIEIWSYGIGRHFEAWIGYCLYHVLQTATFVSGISVVITLFLKYEAARHRTFDRRRLIMAGILTPLALSVLMEVVLIITQSLPSEKRERFKILNANVDDHSIVGFVDFDVIPSVINASIMSSSVILLPTVGILSRWKMSEYIKTIADKSSQLLLSQKKTFANGLVLQTILPLLFYCPISIAYFATAKLHYEFTFQQFFMFLTPAFPALIDPYITIYFVTPYRNTIKSWLGIRKRVSPSNLTIVNSLMNSSHI